MHIVIPVFEALTALDAVGPYEVLQRLPGATVTFAGHEAGPVRTENGFLGVLADTTFEDAGQPDVVVVPGGIGTRALLEDERLLGWLRDVHAGSRFTTSVCTGSLLLAAAGLLDGLTATTHWGARDVLRRLGAEPVAERVVEHLDRRIITAAGVSSGIDMALRLSELLVDRTAAEAMQLMIEYDPQPPTSVGRIELAGEDVLARVAAYSEDKR
ncbi:MAG: DJ-1/PfpI family protein [Actinobacteria bacterium]|nr:DJ-1/PfpI family protein [Actinomycetota bacterium]